jgi:uncharacterized protein YegP (UPF0339 family)
VKIIAWRSDINGQWYVRTRYANGKNHMLSEGFKNHRGATRAIKVLACRSWPVEIQNHDGTKSKDWVWAEGRIRSVFC